MFLMIQTMRTIFEFKQLLQVTIVCILSRAIVHGTIWRETTACYGADQRCSSYKITCRQGETIVLGELKYGTKFIQPACQFGVSDCSKQEANCCTYNETDYFTNFSVENRTSVIRKCEGQMSCTDWAPRLFNTPYSSYVWIKYACVKDTKNTIHMCTDRHILSPEVVLTHPQFYVTSGANASVDCSCRITPTVCGEHIDLTVVDLDFSRPGSKSINCSSSYLVDSVLGKTLRCLSADPVKPMTRVPVTGAGDVITIGGLYKQDDRDRPNYIVIYYNSTYPISVECFPPGVEASLNMTDICSSTPTTATRSSTYPDSTSSGLTTQRSIASSLTQELVSSGVSDTSPASVTISSPMRNESSRSTRVSESPTLVSSAVTALEISAASTISSRTAASTQSSRTVSSVGSGITVASILSSRTVSSALLSRTVSYALSSRTVSSVLSSRTAEPIISSRTVSSALSSRTAEPIISSRTESSALSSRTAEPIISSRTVSSALSSRTDAFSLPYRTVSYALSSRPVASTLSSRPVSSTLSSRTALSTSASMKPSSTVVPGTQTAKLHAASKTRAVFFPSTISLSKTSELSLASNSTVSSIPTSAFSITVDTSSTVVALSTSTNGSNVSQTSPSGVYNSPSPTKQITNPKSSMTSSANVTTTQVSSSNTRTANVERSSTDVITTVITVRVDTSDEGNDNKGLIIGLTVGIILVIAILVAVIMICFCKRVKRKEKVRRNYIQNTNIFYSFPEDDNDNEYTESEDKHCDQTQNGSLPTSSKNPAYESFGDQPAITNDPLRLDNYKIQASSALNFNTRLEGVVIEPDSDQSRGSFYSTDMPNETMDFVNSTENESDSNTTPFETTDNMNGGKNVTFDASALYAQVRKEGKTKF